MDDNLIGLKNKCMNNKLLEHIQNSKLVQAAITEAVHRFYYDRVLSNKISDQQDLIDCNASDILSTLWNLQPNWAYVIKSETQRYFTPNTNSVATDGRPTNPIAFKVEIEIK